MQAWARDKWVDRGHVDGWTDKDEEQMDRRDIEDGCIHERRVGECWRADR